jgi:hypothetical protein
MVQFRGDSATKLDSSWPIALQQQGMDGDTIAITYMTESHDDRTIPEDQGTGLR